MSMNLQMKYSMFNALDASSARNDLSSSMWLDVVTFHPLGSSAALRLLPMQTRIYRFEKLQSMQSEFDNAPQYYANKLITEAGLDDVNFMVPIFMNYNPNFNNYLQQIEDLKTLISNVKSRIEKIKKIKEEMKSNVFLVKDYEFKDKIFSYIDNMRLTEDGKKRFIEKISNFNVVYMCAQQVEDKEMEFIESLIFDQISAP
ncbi:hypothetical protein ROZALSC1DRAFT_20701 [Rozella allomycis CSF55]|uniref:Uncharacterized protein n=1 Tax=Rozella allomycis (strain CSF55) TaxID=988480 RepID=A0A4P9YNC8_ROZAC|nr:hypothetical protein ROZALSC1DRAFT_20701 [Rozella allomycis CSF55]